MKKNYFVGGLICLVLAQTMVGVNIVFSKLLLASIPTLMVLLIRFSLASLMFLPLHWMASPPASLKTLFSSLTLKDWLFIFAQALSAGILFNLFMLSGLNYTDANVAGIITSALPAIIAIMSWIMLREKISAQKILCVIFATIGLVIIAYDKFKGLSHSHAMFGDFLIFLSLFPEAAYYVLCKIYPNRLPLFLTSALLNGINAMLLWPVLLWMNGSAFGISLVNWLMLCLISLSSGLFYVFWSVGAQRVDGTLASLLTAVMPVATVVLAWIILGEPLTSFEFIGMALVLLSIVFYARR